jgi:hypothetical protein
MIDVENADKALVVVDLVANAILAPPSTPHSFEGRTKRGTYTAGIVAEGTVHELPRCERSGGR